jgi:hypothetical protein
MKKMSLVSRALILCAAGPLGACSGDKPVNIGNTNLIGSELSDYAATWDGYAEAYTFSPDNSDHVRLTIGKNGQGTLEVGDQPLVAAPTDPTLGFPPGNEDRRPPIAPPIWEGVRYPIYSAQVQTSRIQVGLKPNDYYAAWCALQTSTSTSYKEEIVTDGGLGGLPGQVVSTQVIVDAGPGTPADAGVTTVYSACPFIPQGSSSPDGVTWTCWGQENGQQVAVDCGKMNLCISMVCACSAAGCDSAPAVATGSAPSQYPVELDAALSSDGTTLTGTLALATDLRVTVVLTKQ